MRSISLATLRIVSLVFLLPGLAGLVLSAVVSTYYVDTLPRMPVPSEMRIIPRDIHGVAIYQTPEENRRLNLVEYSSVCVFLTGLVIGVVYLEKWSSSRASTAEEADLSPAS